MTRPALPPRYAVQRAAGKGWKTFFVDQTQDKADATFREVVRLNPRGYFRLIRLDHQAEADFDGMEFNWKLLALHDPRAGGGPPPRTARERVPIPLRLYVGVILAGILLALVFLVFHQR